MNYEELVNGVRERFMKADVSDIKEHIAYQFNIEGEAQGAFYAKVSEGILSIEPYQYYDRDVLFTCTGETLLDIAGGRLDPVKAFTEGTLKVEGNFDKALKLKEITQRAAEAEKARAKVPENNSQADSNRPGAKQRKAVSKKLYGKGNGGGKHTGRGR